jgi:hypothetical protein
MERVQCIYIICSAAGGVGHDGGVGYKLTPRRGSVIIIDVPPLCCTNGKAIICSAHWEFERGRRQRRG